MYIYTYEQTLRWNKIFKFSFFSFYNIKIQDVDIEPLGCASHENLYIYLNQQHAIIRKHLRVQEWRTAIFCRLREAWNEEESQEISQKQHKSY